MLDSLSEQGPDHHVSVATGHGLSFRTLVNHQARFAKDVLQLLSRTDSLALVDERLFAKLQHIIENDDVPSWSLATSNQMRTLLQSGLGRLQKGYKRVTLQVSNTPGHEDGTVEKVPLVILHSCLHNCSEMRVAGQFSSNFLDRNRALVEKINHIVFVKQEPFGESAISTSNVYCPELIMRSN